MKIYDNNLAGAAAAETQRSQDTQQADRSRTGKPSAGGDANDSVELSGAVGRLSHALSSLHADRTSRVQSLTAQYQNGSYQTDSAATSRGMVGEALAGPH